MTKNHITIALSSVAEISGVDKQQLEKIKEHFTITNPLFWKKQSMELSTWGLDQHLKYYDILDKNKISVPIGVWEEVIPIIGEEYTVIDERITYIDTSPLNIKSNINLYGYQQDCNDALLKHNKGVIEAITASGKTVMFIQHTVSLKEPTLILVNTLDLAKQTIDSFAKFTSLKKSDIGFIGDGQFDLKPITVGTHQTLARLNDKGFKKLNDMFGQIIADEVHIIAAETFFANMKKLKAKYKFGFSSTPTREDGLTKVIHFACGPIIHKVPEDEVKNFIVVPTYKQVATDYSFDLFDTQEYQIMLNYMAEDEERNQQIVDYIMDNIEIKTSICLLCRRVSQVETLYKMLNDQANYKKGEVAFLTSNVKKADRERIMNEVKEGKIKVLVSTYGLMSTGIDVPAFEYLLFCAPVSSTNLIRQAAGRLMRRFKGKKSAHIIDFVDFRIGLLAGQSKKRKKIIEQLIASLT